MTRYTLFAASLAALALASPASAQKAPTIGHANQAAIRDASDASLVGALHEFAYERGALYAIQASPQRITDIALEPGETLLSVSAGDTTRWIVGDARSGNSAGGRAHILVKPNAANLATNLVIMTDRRVYHLDLKSVSNSAMTAVSWRYPSDLMLASNPVPPPAAPAPPVQTSFSPETLNLRYRIDGDKPDWRPLAAFDDGRQVYIEMPETMKTLEAPPLFVIGDEGAELVNYRMAGNYYVVDRLFAKAELKLGTGRRQKRVQIYRQTPIAGGARG
ncbi:MAG: P-type conjugative transfer protein TrbG [Caulobacteraceae bacterium]|nr:MAG: P-type conjugative transfer protein TrbG [Caulobacteraceae bacterium]